MLYFSYNILITTQYVHRKLKVNLLIQYPDCARSPGDSSRGKDSHTDFSPHGAKEMTYSVAPTKTLKDLRKHGCIEFRLFRLVTNCVQWETKPNCKALIKSNCSKTLSTKIYSHTKRSFKGHTKNPLGRNLQMSTWVLTLVNDMCFIIFQIFSKIKITSVLFLNIIEMLAILCYSHLKSQKPRA